MRSAIRGRRVASQDATCAAGTRPGDAVALSDLDAEHAERVADLGRFDALDDERLADSARERQHARDEAEFGRALFQPDCEAAVELENVDRQFARAAAELDDILSDIAQRSPGGAKRVQTRLQATFAALQSNPGLGRRTSNSRLRRIGATPYPYLIFYEWTADEVVIIGIRHGARDPASMPGA